MGTGTAYLSGQAHASSPGEVSRRVLGSVLVATNVKEQYTLVSGKTDLVCLVEQIPVP